MTCVLSVTPIFSSPGVRFAEDKSESLDNFECNWQGARNKPPSGPTENRPRCSSPCRIEATSGLSTVNTFEPVANFSCFHYASSDADCGDMAGSNHHSKLLLADPGSATPEAGENDCSGE